MTDWDSIVAEYGRAVWRTAYRLLNDAADADDCMQEAFVAAVKISRRQKVSHWGGLLYRLATNKALDRLRRRRRESTRRRNPGDWSDLPGSGPAPGRAAEQQELADGLRGVLARLPARQAEAFALRFINEMSNEQIARELGVSVNNVSVILHRARLKLRTLLADAAAVKPT